MVKFIEGSAVFDVSAKLREMLCETLKQGGEKIFLIVPDQFEFETEKTIYAQLNEKGLLTELSRINITTFSSLARGILESSGEKTPPADDIVKSVIMNKAVREQKNMLTALRGAADKTGFCERMVQTVSALKTAGLSANDFGEDSGLFLSDNSERGLNSVVRKLDDVGKIFQSYDNMLSRYADSLDYTKKASELISRADNVFFANSCVFVDCFNDFTGSQMEFIRRMLPKTKDAVFAFVTDAGENPRTNLFGRITAQLDRIRGYAEAEGIEVEIESENLPKRLCDMLSVLSDNIFGKEKCTAKAEEFCELVSASDVYEEADYTAAKIKQLCLEKGFLYREVAVLCADAECGKYIRDAFEKYEIPFFLDIPEPILYQPLVNFFISLLNAVRNFTTDNVLSCLKTGFFGKPNADGTGITAISNKEIDVFENYIFEWNLSAKHLKSEFKFSDKDNINRIEAEAIRKAVAEPILKLRDRLKNKDGAEITRILYDFAANEIDIERTLTSRCYAENSEFDSEAVRVNQQIWNSLVEILEVLETELATEKNITIDEYYRLFSDICANTTLAKPPQYRDCVLVGDIDRTRANGIKAAFIVGASYEKLPASTSGMGVFSDYEAELVTKLIRKNTDADDIRAQSLKSFKEQYCLSLYRAYRAVSLPTEFLSISCPEYDAAGNQISRSAIFSDIARVFPEIKVIKAGNLSNEFYCRSIKAIKQRYSASLGSNSKSGEIMRAYLEKKNYGDFVKKLDEIYEKNSNKAEAANHKLSENTAKQLFKTSFEGKNGNIIIGATSIEKLSKCPFSYFCAKELGIREITKREFNTSNRGIAMHFVMQYIFDEYKDKMDLFFKLSRADFLSLAEKYLAEYLKTQTNGDFENDKRTDFLFRNIASSAADVLITMQTELSVRDYRPKLFELNISNEKLNEISNDMGEYEIAAKPLSLKLNDGTEVFVGGIVDRLDVMFAENEGKPRLYLRVVDYKKKAKTFDRENVKKGINSQMLLYLIALCDANSENEKIEILPGEICYIPSQSTGAAKTKLEMLYLLEMNHKPNGLFIEDSVTEEQNRNYVERVKDIITSQVKPEDEKRKSRIIESINKAFVFNGENCVTQEEFKVLKEECILMVSSNLDRIYGGDISAVPQIYYEKNVEFDDFSKEKISSRTSVKKGEKNDPCAFCNFKAICGKTDENNAEGESGTNE